MINYSFYPTDERLSEYIFSYGTMDLAEGITAPLVSPPNGLTGFLIRTQNSNGEVVGKGFEGKPLAHQPNYVIGQITYPIVGYGKGQFRILVVFFHPLGMYQLFGNKMSNLTNETMDLSDFLGVEKGQKLIDELMVNHAIEKQIDVLNNFFLKQKPTLKDCSIVKQTLEMIHAANGNISVKEIEDTCQISRRSLERHFSEKIGLSPKVYAQIYRFKCTMNYLKENPNITWSELSNIVGYFDQAHLIKYFKEYLKVSPNKLVTLNVDFINYLLHY